MECWEKERKSEWHALLANMNHTFSLPRDIKFDINVYYQSPFIDANTKYSGDPQVNAALSKQFFKNKWTVETNETDFTQVLQSWSNARQIGVSLSYNFQSGGKVSDKKVETMAAEEKARLE